MTDETRAAVLDVLYDHSDNPRRSLKAHTQDQIAEIGDLDNYLNTSPMTGSSPATTKASTSNPRETA